MTKPDSHLTPVVYAIIDQTVQILYIWNNQQDPGRLVEVLKISSYDE